MITNIVASVIFVQFMHLEVWSLGLAYSFSTVVSLGLLIYFLYKKVGGFDSQLLVMPALKMMLAAVAAALALYIPLKSLDQLVFDTTRTLNLMVLTSIASLFGLGIYAILVWMMDVRELQTYVDLLKKLGRIRFKSEEIVNETGNA